MNIEEYPLVDEYDGDGMVESRLYENDSSYLVAVSPHIYENNRIRLKLILGYRVQSMVHGLPSPMDNLNDPYASNRRLLPQTRQNIDRYGNMTPEQFDLLPEHQKRRVLREKYLQRQYQENAAYNEPLLGVQGRGDGTLQSLAYWAIRNFDQLGWKSMLGMIVFLGGLYRSSQR
jgi:hypothetical protein